jgi:hypothetical protein
MNLRGNTGFDDMGYDNRWGSYRLRISKTDTKSKAEVLKTLMQKSF